MQRVAVALIATLMLVSITLPARAEDEGDPYCGINTGLDPACPLTAAGVGLSNSALTDTATLRVDTIFGSIEWRGNEQLDISLPLYEHLGIADVGSAFGTGDMSIGFTRVFAGSKRLAQVAGLSATLPSGAPAFSTGRTQLSTLYALSYALGDRISLVTIGDYSFDAGGTKLPFSPRTQTLSFTPRAVIDLSKVGIYSAIDMQGSNVTGDERYQTYQADATIGLAREHYNVSITYAVPIARFTRENVFYHTIGAQFSWQR